ncbi:MULTISPECIES: hypothetical protein [unclassified Pseudofrankia]|uniref:hypothetical protein n=1 Tax=unclassified Pseudofrankia TaxID=2994372 RepID=UPI0018E34AFE|nr:MULTISPECIES: hypothetical protein [unclassified Pseudofrankia]MDT3439632.1 hypothetical protein [Pseudofrankia sp. BMG5.37]
MRATRGAASRDLDEQTVLGDIYLRGLLRDQRRLAIGVLVALGVGLGLLPALFAFVPDLAGTHVPRLGVGLPWLVLGVVVYPALVLVARAYVRGAERTESDFIDLLSGRPVGGDRPPPLARVRRSPRRRRTARLLRLLREARAGQEGRAGEEGHTSQEEHTGQEEHVGEEVPGRNKVPGGGEAGGGAAGGGRP